MDSTKLQKPAIHLRRALRQAGAALLAVAATSCATMPEPRFERHEFPEDAYVGDVKRPYETLGMVKTRVDFPTLYADRDENMLCSNYYNKAAADLVKRARKIGADAVIDIKSVVFLADGRSETYPTPECVDDGDEGQVLAQGIAIRWKQEPSRD